MKHVIRGVAAMRKLAEKIAAELNGSEVLLLFGELGAGKTTFVQGLARAMGVKEAVTSSSFTLVSEYQTDREGGPRLVHVDLYRLPERGTGHDPAVTEVLERSGEAGRVTVIEWAERLGDRAGRAERGSHRSRQREEDGRIFPTLDVWRIKFAHGKNLRERMVTIEPGPGKGGE